MLKFHGITIIMADLMALKASWNSERSVKSSPSASVSPLVLEEDCLVVMLLMLKRRMESLVDAGFASSIHPLEVMYPASPMQAISYVEMGGCPSSSILSLA
ncbi:MAG: hypothetical protein ACK55Z_13150, partial [bacterium]